MKHFAKKRSPFRAVQWTGAMTPDVQDLLQHRAPGIVNDEDIRVVDQELRLGQQQHGGWRAVVGDWIMSTSEGLSVAADAVFRVTFEEVDELGRICGGQAVSQDERTAAQVRIEYDDDQLNVVAAINKVLKAHGLVLVDDDLFHEGYCIFTLQKIKPSTESKP